VLTAAVSRPPAPRHRSRIAMVLLPVLGLLAGAGIAVALLQALTDPAPGTPANAAERRETGSIVLDADQYIGDPVGQVAARLTELGLDVELHKEVRNDVVPDRVTAVEPDGRPLAAGDNVVVTYAVGDPGASSSAQAVTGAPARGDSATAEDETPADSVAVPETGIADPTSATVSPTPTTLPATPTETETDTETEPETSPTTTSGSSTETESTSSSTSATSSTTTSESERERR
jgi:eukaryotic-like serine/threonine-protein kinase